MRRSIAVRGASRITAVVAVLSVVISGVLISGGPATAQGTAVSAAAGSPGSSVLVFGRSDNGYERDNLGESLRQLGATVEVSAELPALLDGYDEIWNADAYVDLAPETEASLVAFVENGGGLYLTGERPCCEPLNDSVERVVNRLVVGPHVTVGDIGDVTGPFTFNPEATDSITRVPNVLVDFVPDSPGGLQGIGGISDQNVLASNDAIAVGGAWAEGDMVAGSGRLAVLMDIDWLGKDSRTPVIENIHHFLSFGASCTSKDAFPGIVWGSSVPENCTTINTPQGVNFIASVMRGSIDVQISATGIELDCTHFSGDPVTTASQSCYFASAPAAGATISVSAVSSDFGTSTLFYRIKEKNDPRNVPAGYAATSNWWEWPDTDNDGIPNKWELEGVWGKNGFLDLPALGADQNRADLFVYADYQAGFEVQDMALDWIRQAFRESPLNGGQGAEVHFVRGQAIPENIIDDFKVGTGLNQTGFDERGQKDFQRIGTYSGFLASPYATGDGVPQLFKWWLNYDRTVADFDNGVLLGQAVINGNILWTSAESRYKLINNPNVTDSAQNWVRANNFVHELGHTLGLGHGGSGLYAPKDNRTYKSVMSYAYNTFGVRSGKGLSPGRVDYSRENVVNLDWRFKQPGSLAKYGALTFVQGQNGEYSDFYETSFSTVFDFTGEVTEAHNSADGQREVLPSDYAAFAEQFGLEPVLVFPEVDPVETWNPVELPLLGLSARNLGTEPGSVLIDAPPEHGTLVTDGLKLSYTPDDGFAGTDSVTLRVTNGTLSSEQITIGIVLGPESDPGVAPVPVLVAQPSAPNGTNGWYITPVTVTASATDDLDPSPRIELNVDDLGWADYVEPKAVSGDGSHKVAVRASDSAGNISEPLVASVKIDGTAPTTSATGDSKSRQVTLSAADATSGLSRIEYGTVKKHGQVPGKWATYSAPFTVQNKNTIVVYRAVDSAGNTSALTEFKLSTAQPIKTSIRAGADRFLATGDRPVTYTVRVSASSPPVGSIAVFDNGKKIATVQLVAASNGIVTVTLPKMSKGLHVLYAEFSGDGFVTSKSARTPIVKI